MTYDIKQDAIGMDINTLVGKKECFMSLRRQRFYNVFCFVYCCLQHCQQNRNGILRLAKGCPCETRRSAMGCPEVQFLGVRLLSSEATWIFQQALFTCVLCMFWLYGLCLYVCQLSRRHDFTEGDESKWWVAQANRAADSCIASAACFSIESKKKMMVKLILNDSV